jgi:hypothetical protein
VRFRGERLEAEGSILGFVGPGPAPTIEDFVFTGLAPVALVEAACGAGCQMVMRHGYAGWPASEPGNAVGTFASAAAPDLAGPLEGMLVRNRSLVRCSSAWGESGANIAQNWLVSPYLGIGINVASECPLAPAQLIVNGIADSAPYPFRLPGAPEGYGPVGRVGLPPGAPLLAEMDVRSSYALTADACSDGFDGDLDGATDFPADAGCTTPADHSEQPDCADGIDNDGDFAVDHPADPGCAAADAAREDPHCNDGLDNDGDTYVDLADPACGNVASNTSEVTGMGCGVGPELAGLALLLSALRRRGCASA